MEYCWKSTTLLFTSLQTVWLLSLGITNLSHTSEPWVWLRFMRQNYWWVCHQLFVVRKSNSFTKEGKPTIPIARFFFGAESLVGDDAAVDRSERDDIVTSEDVKTKRRWAALPRGAMTTSKVWKHLMTTAPPLSWYSWLLASVHIWLEERKAAQSRL